MTEKLKKVLLISSQVARGSVGATGAAFVLQRKSVDVWSLPSTILSNHHGHQHFAGARIKPVQLRPMLEALEFNDWLEEVDAVMTGYLPTPEHVAFAAEAVDLVRAAHPGALYLCDPAIGDDPKGLYVDRMAAESLRLELLPRADIITPNRFELEWFVAAPVRNLGETIEAVGKIQAAHNNGPKTIVTTSVPEERAKIGNLLVCPDGQWRTVSALRDEVPKGTGDLFAAFYLAEVLKGAPSSAALAKAVAALDILVESGEGLGEENGELPLLSTQDQWAACAPADVEAVKVPA